MLHIPKSSFPKQVKEENWLSLVYLGKWPLNGDDVFKLLEYSGSYCFVIFVTLKIIK